MVKKKHDISVESQIDLQPVLQTVQPKRITFAMIYKDFRRRHPHLSKDVVHWRPHDILMIRIFLEDGMILTYDYWNHKATVDRANWRRDKLHLG